MRKRATEGTKISTSPSITKKMVSTSRREDRLRRNIAFTPSAKAREQPDEPAGPRGEQGRRIKAAGGALAGLASGRVGHDQIGDGTNLEVLGDCQRPGRDLIARAGPEDRR